jgi:3'(2'), 5'-bisphosphate nucleotidase
MSDLDREIDVAARIAREAGELVQGYRGKQLTISAKAGDEPVSDADIAANALIVARLSEAFPDDVILSEEIPDTGERLGRRRVWMVDPIDGTRDFIAGDSGFVVMIGLAIDGRPAVGAVAHPITGHVYMGAAGVGAWRDATLGERVASQTSRTSSPHDIRLVASKSHRTARVDAVKQALQITDEMNVGSIGLKIGLVSEGVRDLYFYGGGRTKIWDTCGPEAILVGAGGRLTDVDGQPLVYDRPELYNRRGIVASNGPLHDFVITTVAPLVGTY